MALMRSHHALGLKSFSIAHSDATMTCKCRPYILTKILIGMIAGRPLSSFSIRKSDMRVKGIVVRTAEVIQKTELT